MLCSPLVLIGSCQRGWREGDLTLKECAPLGESPHARPQTMILAANDVIVRSADTTRHITKTPGFVATIKPDADSLLLLVSCRGNVTSCL